MAASTRPLQPNSFYVGYAVDLLNTRCAPDSVDLVLTSPPYDDLRLYQGYSFDAEQMLATIYRVAKPGGVCVWVVSERTKHGRRRLTSSATSSSGSARRWRATASRIDNIQSDPEPHE